LAVVESSPALFTLDFSGKGQAAMLNETGCCNSTRNPAARGAVAVLYATGEGQTNPPGIDGSISWYPRIDDYPVPRLPLQLTVGGEPVEILYAGEAPHVAQGLLQVNFRIPANGPLGDAVPVVLTVGNFHSPDGVTVAIRPAVQQVLVIEAEPVTRNWLRTVLAGSGYEVFVATNGRQAQVQADRHPIDLVISQLGTPEGERLETIRRIRERAPQLKVIVTVRALGPRTLRAADLLGAEAVLTKPMTSKAVLQRVRDVLRPRPLPYERTQDIPPLPLRPNAPR
jgi:CheY-like chemotaxis protein